MKFKEEIYFILSVLFKEKEVKIDKQVSVSFTIRKYKDEVLFDVVPMEAGHIFLDAHGNFIARKLLLLFCLQSKYLKIK
ncbi:hypothetical protein CR513_43751, partial [Mucuna pruriens]